MSSIKKQVAGIIELSLSLFLLFGALTVFNTCDLHDGKTMACYWADRMVVALGVVLAVQAVLRLLFRNTNIKKGIVSAMLPLAVLCIFIPDRIISLCMMDTMRCQAVFKPSVMVISVLLVLVMLADIVIMTISTKKDNS